jgi:hypothetical protein
MNGGGDQDSARRRQQQLVAPRDGIGDIPLGRMSGQRSPAILRSRSAANSRDSRRERGPRAPTTRSAAAMSSISRAVGRQLHASAPGGNDQRVVGPSPIQSAARRGPRQDEPRQRQAALKARMAGGRVRASAASSGDAWRRCSSSSMSPMVLMRGGWRAALRRRTPAAARGEPRRQEDRHARNRRRIGRSIAPKRRAISSARVARNGTPGDRVDLGCIGPVSGAAGQRAFGLGDRGGPTDMEPGPVHAHAEQAPPR